MLHPNPVASGETVPSPEPEASASFHMAHWASTETNSAVIPATLPEIPAG